MLQNGYKYIPNIKVQYLNIKFHHLKRERVISKHCPRDRLPTNVFNQPENDISTGGKVGFNDDND